MPEFARNPNAQRSVLVVEDEPAICDLISEILQSHDLTPICAQNDAEAYAALRDCEAFACMIVDVNLGRGTTGYDVARFARQIERALPIIFVSGQTSPDSFRANGAPGSLFLPKPFTGQELMKRLSKLVGDNDD